MALPTDWEREKLITLKEAVPLLKKRRVQSIYRLVNDGRPLPGGGRVYLEVVHLGTQWLTSVEAVRRFVERCSGLPRQLPARTPEEAAKAGKRAGDKIRAELAADRVRHGRSRRQAAGAT